MVAIPRLSHSSLSTYADCGERWRLEKVFKVPVESWYATVGGTVVHTLTELHDQGLPLDNLSEEFKTFLDIEITKAEQKGTTLKVSGKKLKEASLQGGPNKRDYDWWLEFGPKMVENWIEFRRETDWTLATMPDGSPGIEVDLYADVAGRPFKGFIDRVFLTPEGQVVIVDIKTGTLPLGQLQLATYAVALERQHGLRAEWGAYWHPVSGISYLKDLTKHDADWIDSQYEMAWNGIEAEVFMPNVGSACTSFCGVRKFCRAFGGDEAFLIPAKGVLTDPISVQVGV